jgi:hypothetical protein
VSEDNQSQLDKYGQAAREQATDGDLDRVKERPGRLAKRKPVPEQPE